MTETQERAITLALNVLHVGFFECPRHDYQYFLKEDDWALLMTAGGANAVNTPPAELAIAVLNDAVRRKGFFAHMSDFKPPAHYCSFLREQVRRGERQMDLQPCAPNQATCPYATYEMIKESR